MASVLLKHDWLDHKQNQSLSFTVALCLIQNCQVGPVEVVVLLQIMTFLRALYQYEIKILKVDWFKEFLKEQVSSIDFEF